jgi:flagellar basal body-associated protein FliL
MEKMKKKKSKLEYLIVFLLIFIVAIFASRIFHILQASSKGCGATCPVTGMDSKKVKPVENNNRI